MSQAAIADSLLLAGIPEAQCHQILGHRAGQVRHPDPHRASPGKGEVQKLLKVVSSIASGAGVALPEGQSIELLQSAARAGGDFKDFVGYFDTSITTLLLGQSSTTDQGPWRGTAEIQKDVRDEVIASDCHLLDAALNMTIARWLTAWNFSGAAPLRIAHDASPPEDLDKRASREETIGSTGMTPHVLGLTRGGHPRHPLYMPRNATPRPWHG